MKILEDCVFCKIVAGRLPSARLLETDRVLAFLDIAPIIKGHSLVIPKEHYESIEEVPGDLLGDMIRAAADVARAIRRGLGAEGVNLHHATGSCAGQVVPHVHLHVLPRHGDDGFRWNWRHLSYDGPPEMAEWQRRISAGLADASRP